MRSRSGLLIIGASIALVSYSVACGSKSSDGSTTGDDANIIGGVDASSASLNAVGAILYKDQNGNINELCSASLIAPQVILTAKHCAVQFGQTDPDAGPVQLTQTKFIDAFPAMYFAIGADVKTARLVPLDSVSLCNDYNGGWIGYGCDYSTYHLAQAVTDVKPLKVAQTTLTDATVGKRLTAIGYGIQNQTQTALGTRRAGSLTLRATHGQPLHAVFATVDDFEAAVQKDEGAALVANSLAALQQIYDMSLKDGYEVYLGMGDGDAQVCFGDSGGPIVMPVDGELVIQGVASAVGVSGAVLPCNIGAIYSVPGPAAQTLIAESTSDACAGVPAAGRCDGDVAVRCSHADEGPRHVVKNDCSGLLLHCVVPAAPDADAGSDAGAGAPAEVTCQ